MSPDIINQISTNYQTMQTITDITDNSLQKLLQHYRMKLSLIDSSDAIPGSHWGDSEAGLIGEVLYVRADTPTHSALHETCHYICMDSNRRAQLHTDAGGDYDEENAVCYLQILLADYITGNSQATLMKEMNAWGYSFRLGSADRWFKEDADDARQWLLDYGLITQDNAPIWTLRS